ncbi:LSB5 (YCL034W) [Zygosaccharomyces parabailii]|nr:LSB5 (YCL034W) [Zygosaccharomyces parabailii]
MGFFTDHQHTSITDTINTVTSRDDFAVDEELPNLLGLIKNCSSKYEYINNQEEAARALRKKLKYGSKLQARRAFDVLDLFVSQGIKMGALYNDAKLLERVSIIALGRATDARGEKYSPKQVKMVARSVLAWYDFIVSQGLEKSRTYEGLYQISLQVKKKYKRSRRTTFMEDAADKSIFASDLDPERHQTHPDDLYRIPQINVENEVPKIRMIITDGLATSVALKNALMVLPAGESSLDDPEATGKFEQARTIRRKVLRYLQVVTEGDYLGSLIHCNEELVAALTEYDERAGDSPKGSTMTSDVSDANNSYEDDPAHDEEESRSFQEEGSPVEDPFGDDKKI